MLVVVVVYNKTILEVPFFNNSFDANIPQAVFVYDNSPRTQVVPEIPGLEIKYMHDPGNSGVSAAYNSAYFYSGEIGESFLLILDQDSIFDIASMCSYEAAYMKFGNAYIYAPVVTDFSKRKIYSPSRLRRFVGKIQLIEEFRYQEVYSLEGMSLINSGLGIPVNVFKKLGGYNDKIKLDFSDVYFIERYKEVNINVILLDVFFKHSISGDEGIDFNREINRFRYYCSAARELGRSLNKMVFWSPFRRMLRLIYKYRDMSFFRVFWKYYIVGVVV